MNNLPLATVLSFIIGFLSSTAYYISLNTFERGMISVSSGLRSCELVETVNNDKSSSKDWVCVSINKDETK